MLHCENTVFARLILDLNIQKTISSELVARSVFGSALHKFN